MHVAIRINWKTDWWNEMRRVFIVTPKLCDCSLVNRGVRLLGFGWLRHHQLQSRVGTLQTPRDRLRHDTRPGDAVREIITLGDSWRVIQASSKTSFGSAMKNWPRKKSKAQSPPGVPDSLVDLAVRIRDKQSERETLVPRDRRPAARSVAVVLWTILGTSPNRWITPGRHATPAPLVFVVVSLRLRGVFVIAVRNPYTKCVSSVSPVSDAKRSRYLG